MTTTEKIKSTKAFSKLTKIQKSLIIKSKSEKEIKLGITMSGLTSFDNWVKVSSPRQITKDIVLEIVNFNKQTK